MPVTKSATIALRKDRYRTVINSRVRSKLKTATKQCTQNPSPQNLAALYSAADRASKKNIIHPNKASRIKAQFARFAKSSPQK